MRAFESGLIQSQILGGESIGDFQRRYHTTRPQPWSRSARSNVPSTEITTDPKHPSRFEYRPIIFRSPARADQRLLVCGWIDGAHNTAHAMIQRLNAEQRRAGLSRLAKQRSLPRAQYTYYSSTAAACLGSFVAPVLDSDISSRATWVKRLSAISSSARDLLKSSATAGSPI